MYNIKTVALKLTLFSFYIIVNVLSLEKSEDTSVASTTIDSYHPPTILQMYNMSNVSLYLKVLV